MKTLSINPATEEVIGEYEFESVENVIEKIGRLKERVKTWKAEEKKEKLLKVKEELLKREKECAEIITEEMGKPIRQAIAEVRKCANLIEYYVRVNVEEEEVSLDGKIGRVEFEPLGVILAIMPWNFPFWQVFRFSIPAMYMGNAVILKHAPNTTGCALKIKEILKDLPFDIVIIHHEYVKDIIPYTDGVAFTGSTETGRKVAKMAGENLKKHIIELGGSDPFIVFEDVDIDLVVEKAVYARTINSGQSCIAAKRFIISEKIYDKFKKKLIERLTKIKIGNPKEDVDIGPIARKDLLEKALLQVEDAKKNGLNTIGGYKIGDKGFFFYPAIIEVEKTDVKVMKEETFAPIFPLIKFKTEEEAIKIANETEYGLAGSIWTKDEKRAKEVAKMIESGMVFINSVPQSDPRIPFGGIKSSGYGRELGKFGLLEFVNIKSIVIG